jgi:hypothetical protein
MRRNILVILLLACIAVAGRGQLSYDRFFTQKTLRVDYFHTGTKGQEVFSLDEVIEEGEWPGSRVNLIDTLNLGEYLVRVYDVQTNMLIYSRGYSTIFNEWQTTDEALRGMHRTFSETVRLPYPRRKIQLAIARRDKRMEFHELWTIIIDPNDPLQVNRAPARFGFTSARIMGNGKPAEKVDIVIIGDGYAKTDMQKFRNDAKHFNDILFATEPFRSRKSDFNVWVIEAESEDSGIDVPDKNVWKRNVLGSRYSTFGLPRYVLTTENKTLRNIASIVPYDFICILVNDTRYGGGGIYNLYATTYTKEQTRGQEWQMDYVYVHEFGHSFGGLGDEYYGSTTAYNDFYSPGVEPWEPNVTALTDRNNLKWKSFVAEGTPVPTPWDKAAYDSLEAERGKLDRLAPDYYQKREPILQAQAAILRNSPYAGKVGAFEGAGYASKGLYRPAVDCRMFSLSLVDFDPVCNAAIRRVIDFYAK